MADQKQVEMLLRGVEEWNAWRRDNKEVRPDLRDADFSGADLREANLSYADLSYAELREADLSYADLTGADLREADLTGADLSLVDLREADLTGANLSRADLTMASFFAAIHNEANLSECLYSSTTFSRINLGLTNGLSGIMHAGPSTIGTSLSPRLRAQRLGDRGSEAVRPRAHEQRDSRHPAEDL